MYNMTHEVITNSLKQYKEYTHNEWQVDLFDLLLSAHGLAHDCQNAWIELKLSSSFCWEEIHTYTLGVLEETLFEIELADTGIFQVKYDGERYNEQDGIPRWILDHLQLAVLEMTEALHEQQEANRSEAEELTRRITEALQASSGQE